MEQSAFQLFDACNRENFASAVLASTLRMSPPFRREFLELLRSKTRLPANASADFEVQREVSIESEKGAQGRIDILITGQGADGDAWAIAIECKLWASFQDSERSSQLGRYREWLAEEFPGRYSLVVLALKDQDDDHQGDGVIRWGDLVHVAKKLSAVKSSSDFERQFLEELASYLQEISMEFMGFKFPARFRDGQFDLQPMYEDFYAFIQSLTRQLGAELKFRNKVWEAYSGWEYHAYYFDGCINEKEITGLGFFSHAKSKRHPRGTYFEVYGAADSLLFSVSLDDLVQQLEAAPSPQAFVEEVAKKIQAALHRNTAPKSR